MTLTGASQNMPFNVDMALKAQQYGHPNVYPNSEYIKPPLEKKKLRVVDPATRTEISIQRFKDMQERVDELRETLQTNKNGLTKNHHFRLKNLNMKIWSNLLEN